MTDQSAPGSSGYSSLTQTGEPEAAYKTSGAVNALRPGENNNVYAVVSRNIFYDIDLTSHKINRCIKFNKHSITAFYCCDNQLVFGNIDNKLLVYDLDTFDPDAPEVAMF